MGEKKSKQKEPKKHGRWYYWLFDPGFALGMAAADREHDLGLDHKTKGKRRRGIRRFWPVTWFLLLTYLYWARPDGAYAITIWPAWVALAIGLVLTAFSRSWKVVIFCLWAIFSFVFVDEFKSLPRGLRPEPPHNLRVVILNCAGGTYAAAEEAMAQKPDIVFFQESCGAKDLHKLANHFFGAEGSVLSGPDASIIARGKLSPIKTPRGTIDYVIAKWTDKAGHSLNLMSLRLAPPLMRMDLYNPEAWSSFSADRAHRRREAERMVAELRSLHFGPDLMGGDFNSPPDQGQVGALTGDRIDAFAEVGVGFGSTCVNPNPCIERIDQLWYSTAITATRSRVVATENSDHRMLVSDFLWK